MNNQTIVMCVVALVLGMLLANMLKNVCGCKLTEGQGFTEHGFRIHTPADREHKRHRQLASHLKEMGMEAIQAQREKNKHIGDRAKDRMIDEYRRAHLG